MVASHDRKKRRTKIEERGRTAMLVGYADDHTGDECRFIHIKAGQIILFTDVRWLNIMWKGYIQKQRRLNQNMEESESDSDSEDDYDEFHDNSKTNDVIREEQEDQAQDSKPTTQERRLGINRSMRGTRESSLGSTRSQT